MAMIEQAQSIDLLFLGNFVHQVVAPLNGIAGTLSNVADDTYSIADRKQRINAARAQLEQCIQLVRNLAFFSEISSSNVLPSPQNSGVSVMPQVIIEALQFFQESALQKG